MARCSLLVLILESLGQIALAQGPAASRVLALQVGPDPGLITRVEVNGRATHFAATRVLETPAVYRLTLVDGEARLTEVASLSKASSPREIGALRLPKGELLLKRGRWAGAQLATHGGLSARGGGSGLKIIYVVGKTWESFGVPFSGETVQDVSPETLAIDHAARNPNYGGLVPTEPAGSSTVKSQVLNRRKHPTIIHEIAAGLDTSQIVIVPVFPERITGFEMKAIAGAVSRINEDGKPE